MTRSEVCTASLRLLFLSFLLIVLVFFDGALQIWAVRLKFLPVRAAL